MNIRFYHTPWLPLNTNGTFKPQISTTFMISLCITTTILSACASTENETTSNRTKSSMLERIPIVYRQDIQQGNVFDQNIVNQLRPGLTQQQVKFIMGTPMIVDVFRQTRWDYVYTMTYGWGETEVKRVQIYFDQSGLLERVTGDFKPILNAQLETNPETLVQVPDYKDPNRGIIKRAAEAIGSMFRSSPDPQTPPP